MKKQNNTNKATTEAKENPGSYNGPEFEDLDDKLQEGLDEFLAELGIGDDVIDFVDAKAVDKDQQLYMGWLQNLKRAVESK